MGWCGAQSPIAVPARKGVSQIVASGASEWPLMTELAIDASKATAGALWSGGPPTSPEESGQTDKPDSSSDRELEGYAAGPTGAYRCSE